MRLMAALRRVTKSGLDRLFPKHCVMITAAMRKLLAETPVTVIDIGGAPMSAGSSFGPNLHASCSSSPMRGRKRNLRQRVRHETSYCQSVWPKGPAIEPSI